MPSAPMLLDAVAAPVLISDPAGRVTACNPVMATALDRPVAAVIGATVMALWTLPGLPEAPVTVWEGEGATATLVPRPLPDGAGMVWTLQPREVVGALRPLVEALPVGLAWFDADDRLRLANRRFLDPLPLMPEAAVGVTHAALIRQQVTAGVLVDDRHDREAEGFIAELATRHGPPAPAPRELSLSDGRTLLALEAATPGGETLCLRVDITGQKQALAAVQRHAATERLITRITARFVGAVDGALQPLLAEALADMASFVDADRAGLYRQPTAMLPHGDSQVWTRPGQAPGAKPFAEVSSETFPWLHDRLSHGEQVLIEEQDALPEAAVAERAHMARHQIEGVLAVPLLDGAHLRGVAVFVTVGRPGVWTREHILMLRVVSGIMTAVLERQESRLALVEAVQRAESASRAKTEFLANMSHELRTPLNAVMGFADMMRLEVFGPLGAAQYRAYATDILTSGQYLLTLITDLLDLARLDLGRRALEPEPVSLPEVVESVLVLVRERARQGDITLDVVLADSLPAMVAERRGLIQVLSNLVNNGIKFTPAGGHVTLTVVPGGRGVHMTVADSGVGIAADQLARLGQAFTQVKPAYTRDHPGAGIGLALSRGLVELHGGTLTLESTPGAGTTVTLDWPLTPEGAATETVHENGDK